MGTDRRKLGTSLSPFQIEVVRLGVLDVSGEDLGLVLADSGVPITHHSSVLVMGDCMVSNAARVQVGMCFVSK